MKLCKRCNEEKPLDKFYKNLRSEARCRECVKELRKIEYRKNPQKHIERTTKRRLMFPDKIKDGKLKQAFGVEYGFYDRKLKEQNGVCAICEQPPKATRLHLDHDHITGEIRSLLCSACNTSLGLLQENIQVIENMILYINKFKK